MNDTSFTENFIMKSETFPHPHHHTKVWLIKFNHNHRNIREHEPEILDNNMTILWPIGPE